MVAGGDVVLPVPDVGDGSAGERCLDDLDSYMDDLGSRLTVLRMVSDSVVKGIVAAVQSGASERIALKESELTKAKEMLLLQMQGGPEWETLRNIALDIASEFKEKLIDSCKNSWDKKALEISAVRRELAAMSEVMLSSESGAWLSQRCPECSSCGKRKDRISKDVDFMESSDSLENSLPAEIGETPLLNMTNAELIAHFKSEMTKMRRQHESALQEKTEELFLFKRESHKEKGSSNPTGFRKDKEVEMTQKRVLEMISKLDIILLEGEKLPLIDENKDVLCNTADDMIGKTGFLVASPSDVVNHMIYNPCLLSDFLMQVEKVNIDLEGVKTEASFRDDIFKVILLGYSSEIECGIQALCMENYVAQQIEAMVLGKLFLVLLLV